MMMGKNSKQRLFEIFNVVNKTAIKEYINEEQELDEKLYGMSYIIPGSKVKIGSGAGNNSNKVGVVLSPTEVSEPYDSNKIAAVKLEDGTTIKMFKDRLVKIN